MSDTSGPAFPLIPRTDPGTGRVIESGDPGMTLRQYAAIKIAAGRPNVYPQLSKDAAAERKYWADEVVRQVDALLAALKEES